MLNCWKWIRGAIVGLAALGTVMPRTAVVVAAETKASRPTVRTTDAKVLDIVLSKGSFTGRVVDHTGTAVEGAAVTLKLGNTEVARTVSDRTGTFTVNDLKAGVYTVSSGATSGVYRLWTEKTAPPAANSQGLLIMGQNGERGQFAAVDSCGNLLIGTIALGALIVAIIALVEAENNKAPNSP